jgi:hypothetical protein
LFFVGQHNVFAAVVQELEKFCTRPWLGMQDLIIEHNKRSNPTPPMAQPMRQAGGAANGAM